MKSKTLYGLLSLVVLNCIVLWVFLNTEKKLNSDRKQTLEEKLDVTIVIPEFEHFDNDITATVQSIATSYPTLPILVLSDGIPYPYPKLSTGLARYVFTSNNPTIPRQMSDPFNFIKSKYVLLVPDGSRIIENSIEKIVWSLKTSKDSTILVAPISNEPIACKLINLDLKLWTLKYTTNTDIKGRCEYVVNDAAYLLEARMFQNFSEVFVPPFHESFFIQAKVNNLKLNTVSPKGNYFKRGKFLFTDRHKKWKHNTKIQKQREALYKRFGIKRLLTSSGQEKWYGCSKATARCFPSVIDVPYFLYQERWTPPCCLNALRRTARYVFSTLEQFGIVYWLEGGSLLGAARHGDIIPWDYDVDIGMFLNETNKAPFLKTVWSARKKHIDQQGYVWERATEGDFIRVQYSVTNHLHVDIFPFFEKDGVMTKNTWFKSHRQDMEFPAHFLKPLERLMFVGVEAMVPNHHRKFLELKFGEGVIEKPQYPFPEKLLGVQL